MDFQNVVNVVLAGGFGALGWFGRTLYAAVEGLKSDLANHKVEVARDYVPNRDLDEIKSALIRIESAVHAKADR